MALCLDPDFYDGELGDSGDFDAATGVVEFTGQGWTGAAMRVGSNPAFSAWQVGDLEEILGMFDGTEGPAFSNQSAVTGSGSERDAAAGLQWSIPPGSDYALNLGLSVDLSPDGADGGGFEAWLGSFGILKSGETTALSGEHWFDISGTGEAVVLGDDELSEPVVLPFEFDFFGDAKREVSISSDGWLSFGDGDGVGEGAALDSSVALPGEFIALFATDLDPSAGGAIYTQATADAFVVQFQDVPLAGGIDGDFLTAQVVLTRGGEALFSYREVPFADEVVVGMQGGGGLSRVLVEDVVRLADREQTFGVEQGDAMRLDRDTDGDGRTDFGEFCFGGDPTVPDVVEVVRFVEGLGSGEVVLEYSRRRDLGDGSVAIDYRIEAGGGDGAWRTVSGAVEVVGEAGEFDVVRVTLGDIGVKRELVRVVARLEEVAGAATLEVGSEGVEVGVEAAVAKEGSGDPDEQQEPDVLVAFAPAGAEIEGAARLDTPVFGDEVAFEKNASLDCESKIGQEFERLLEESDVLESALAAIMHSLGVDESSRPELLESICQSIDQQSAANGYDPQPNDVYKFSFGPRLRLGLSKNFGATAYSALLFSAGANFNVDWVPGQWVQFSNKIAFTVGVWTFYGGMYLKVPSGAYAATDKIEVGLSFSHQAHSPKLNAGPNFAGFFGAGITWNHSFSSGTTKFSTELEVREFVRLMGVSDFSGAATKLMFPGFYHALEYLEGDETDSVEVMSIPFFQNLWRLDGRTDNIIGILLHSRFDIIHETGNGGVDLWLKLSAGIPLILPAELVSYAIPFPTPRAQLVGGIGFHRSWSEEKEVLAEDVEGWNLVFDELDAIDWIASQGIELYGHQFGWSEIDEERYRVAFDKGISDSMDPEAVQFNPLSDVAERSYWVHGDPFRADSNAGLTLGLEESRTLPLTLPSSISPGGVVGVVTLMTPGKPSTGSTLGISTRSSMQTVARSMHSIGSGR